MFKKSRPSVTKFLDISGKYTGFRQLSGLSGTIRDFPSLTYRKMKENYVSCFCWHVMTILIEVKILHYTAAGFGGDNDAKKT